MSHPFMSLGELGDYVSNHAPTMHVVDPPMTLMEAVDSKNVWSSQPAVRKVVDFIARQLASTPLNYFERVDDTQRLRIGEGPIAELLHRPSAAPRTTRYRFWHRIVCDWLIYDRWCALITTHEGRPWLDRIPPRRFAFHTDALDRVDEVRIWRKDGTHLSLSPEQCLFDTGYSPGSGVGTSPMETLKDILAEASAGTEYRRDILNRGARVPSYIFREKPWPADGKARDRFVAGWRAFEAGGGRAGGTPMFEDGMELRAVDTFKPVDLQLVEGRKLTDIEVATAYHIAPEIVGAREGTFSNVDAYRQMLYGPSLGPYFDAWMQAVDEALAEPGRYIEANLDVKMRGSFIEQAQITSTATGAPWMTRNEARAMRNLAPVTGGDDLVTPLNVLVGGQASPRDSGSQNLGPKSGATPSTKSRTPHAKSAQRDAGATQITSVLKAFFARQGDSVLSAIGANGAWWDQTRWDSELADDLLRVTHTLSTLVGEAEAERLGYSDGYDPDRTVAFLTEVSKRYATTINETTKGQVDAALADVDLDPAHVFETAETSRADGVGEYLGTFTASFGSVEAARHISSDQGLAPTKTWNTGANPRASHAAMNGETVSIDETFSNGLDYPGSGGDPDEVAGCNCDVTITIP